MNKKYPDNHQHQQYRYQLKENTHGNLNKKDNDSNHQTKQVQKKSQMLTINQKPYTSNRINKSLIAIQKLKNDKSLTMIRQCDEKDLHKIQRENRKLLEQRQALFSKNCQLVDQINKLKQLHYQRKFYTQASEKPVKQQVEYHYYKPNRKLCAKDNIQFNKTIDLSSQKQKQYKSKCQYNKNLINKINLNNKQSKYSPINQYKHAKINPISNEEDQLILQQKNFSINQKTFLMPLSSQTVDTIKNCKVCSYQENNQSIANCICNNTMAVYSSAISSRPWKGQQIPIKYYPKTPFPTKKIDKLSFIQTSGKNNSHTSKNLLRNHKNKNSFIEQLKSIQQNKKNSILQEKIKRIKQENIQLRYEIFKQ